MNELIEKLLKECPGQGFFVDEVFDDYQVFKDLDGTHAREWLTAKGYEVTLNVDTGRCGVAFTSCRLRLSTNGYIYRS